MTKLCVNIDHVATVRQARKQHQPSPILAAHEVRKAGIHGITVHLREDRRHIQDEDIKQLRAMDSIRLNLEMAATDEMVGIACRLRPDIVMLVPEGRDEVTTEGGLDIATHFDELAYHVQKLKASALPLSVFIDADIEQVRAASELGADVCEIHTGPFSYACSGCAQLDLPHHDAVESCLALIQLAGEEVINQGMQFNAGHGLDYQNTAVLLSSIKGISELHIGHAIVSHALFVGLNQAVFEMKTLIETHSK